MDHALDYLITLEIDLQECPITDEKNYRHLLQHARKKHDEFQIHLGDMGHIVHSASHVS